MTTFARLVSRENALASVLERDHELQSMVSLSAHEFGQLSLCLQNAESFYVSGTVFIISLILCCSGLQTSMLENNLGCKNQATTSVIKICSIVKINLMIFGSKELNMMPSMPLAV